MPKWEQIDPKKYTHVKWVDMPHRNKYCFTFVRHPFGWCESYWNAKQPKNDWWGTEFEKECGDKDFDTFINNVINRGGYLTELYKKAIKGMNFIGKQESLREDLERALDSAGEVYDKDKVLNRDRVNVTKKTKFLDNDQKEQISKVEEWVIDTFYDKD